MAYPTLSDYQDAMQNPSVAFADASLRNAKVTLTPLGIPKPFAGGFAITFNVANSDGMWAVRCFHKQPMVDLERRYSAIKSFLAPHGSPLFLPFEYQPKGILVRGDWFPIVKMKWGTGKTLSAYIEQNHANSSLMESVSTKFRSAVAEIGGLGLAHGDLQHGNILVGDNGLVLVDYDGMFVPELDGEEPGDLGHFNYQISESIKRQE